MIRNKCSKCGGWDSSVPHKWRVINGQYIKSIGVCRQCEKGVN